MSKVAQSASCKIRQWIAPHNKDIEAFSTDGTVVFCNICTKGVGCDRKSQIDALASTAQHVGALARKKKEKRERQMLLTPTTVAPERKNAFFMDLCYALIASNIPLHKLSYDPFHQFLRKYTQNQVPADSTLRKNYVPVIFEDTIRKIRQIVGENYVYICVDESTDARGLYIANLLIGVLRPDAPSQTYLIACQQLERTNHETISRFINKNLRRFYESNSFEDRIILLVSDAAPYMIKAGVGLKLFYKNLRHLTCIVHAFHRLAEEVRDMCPEVNVLVSCGKKMFLKSPTRVETYRQIMRTHLPPEPVITRWGTWLSATLFYSENFERFQIVVDSLEPDAKSVVKAKTLVKSRDLLSQLTFLQAHVSCLPQSIEHMMRVGQKLQDQIEILDRVRVEINRIPGNRGETLKTKLAYVLGKNSGLQFLEQVLKMQRGDPVDD